MTQSRFFTLLGLTTLASILILWLLYTMAPHTQQQEFASFFTTIMVGLSVGMFFQAKKATSDPNPYTYSRKFLGFTGLKMLLCVTIILAYKYAFPQIDKNYLYSFLIVYVLFTILETYVFMKLSKPEAG